MLHEEGIVMKLEPPSDGNGALIDFDEDKPDALARAAWIKLSKFEEHATAVLEASALIRATRNATPATNPFSRGVRCSLRRTSGRERKPTLTSATHAGRL
jgi:hypothetical protein